MLSCISEKKISLTLILIITVSILLSFGFNGFKCKAEDPKDFYEGKTLTIVVPYGPGGGFDTFARTVAPLVSNYIPELKVFVKNVEGAGSLIGTNEVFNAEPDGLKIGIIPASGSMIAQLIDKPGVRFKMDEWSWVARASAEPHVLCLATKSDIKSLDDMLNASEPVTFATEGIGSDDHYGLIAEMETLGVPYKLITGYKGSKEPKMAIVRGEVDGGQMSYSSALPNIKGGDYNPVLQITLERNENLPDVPTGAEVVSDEKDKAVMNAFATIFALDRTFAGPPGIPEERLELLRDTFEKIFKSKEFQEDLAAKNRFPNFMKGSKVNELLQEAYKSTDIVKELLE